MARTSGTTAPSIRGSSNGSGILNRRSTIEITFTPAWKMPHSSNQKTAENRGRSCQVCANMTPALNGSRAQAACVCTPFFSIRKIDNEFSSLFRLQARSGPTTAVRRGSRSIAVCIRNTCLIPLRRSATVFIASRCIHRVRTHCSCKSTGM